mmetsp:Transcript_19548/g.52703  ORF Transcript_19548/g.52703 Transcript_19548/m.52703 type:complete len:230 (-) Transcript_19548:749-1438(-)
MGPVAAPRTCMLRPASSCVTRSQLIDTARRRVAGSSQAAGFTAAALPPRAAGTSCSHHRCRRGLRLHDHVQLPCCRAPGVRCSQLSLRAAPPWLLPERPPWPPYRRASRGGRPCSPPQPPLGANRMARVGRSPRRHRPHLHGCPDRVLAWGRDSPLWPRRSRQEVARCSARPARGHHRPQGTRTQRAVTATGARARTQAARGSWMPVAGLARELRARAAAPRIWEVGLP